MARIVQKFGGTSLGDIERIKNVARRVKSEFDRGSEVAVVVSAMAGTTNQLVDWTRDMSRLHDAREYDVVVASGEQVTAGLLALALQDLGIDARSWLGWQVPIRTDGVHGKARIEAIEVDEIRRRLTGAGGRRRRVSRNGAAPASNDPGPRRLGHLRGCARGGSRGRPLRYLHRCGRRIYGRSADRGQSSQAGQDHLRRNVGNGVARRQGAADALGRDGDELSGARPSVVELYRQSRNPGGRRRRARGKASCERHRIQPRRSQDHRAERRRSPGRCGRHLRAARRGRDQCRHDRAERLGERAHRRSDLHGRTRRPRARRGGARKGPGDDRLFRAEARIRTSSRSR